jgi:hypothetical protein
MVLPIQEAQPLHMQVMLQLTSRSHVRHPAHAIGGLSASVKHKHSELRRSAESRLVYLLGGHSSAINIYILRIKLHRQREGSAVTPYCLNYME